jgi:aspartate 1-decarboxylase
MHGADKRAAPAADHSVTNFSAHDDLIKKRKVGLKPVGRSLYWPPPAKSTAIKMQVQMLKSKIHRAAVTDANVNYEGSLTVDRALMEEVGLLPYERVLCGNMGNGERFETYAIPGESGSGAIILNGATAHLGKTGDRLTIMSFATVDEAEIAGWKPKVIVLDEHNGIIARR